MNKDQLIPLIIDSTYEGFQMIHSDVRRGYSIACKFCNFNTNSFDISESVIILASPLGEVRIPFFGLKKSEEVVSDDYAFKMKANFIRPTSNPIQIGDNINRGCTKNTFKRKLPNETFNKKTHLIDVEIDKKHLIPFSNDLIVINEKNKIVVNHGNQFCRFYIL